MVGHGGSSAGSYLADPTSPIPSHCASIVATSTLRANVGIPIMKPQCHLSGSLLTQMPRSKSFCEVECGGHTGEKSLMAEWLEQVSQ